MVAGGYLDIRFVATFRGGGRRLNNQRTALSVGATAYIEAGGTFLATG